MSIVFTAHGRTRFMERSKLPIGAGKRFIEAGYTKPCTLSPYAKKMLAKQTDASLTIIQYKRFLFVVRINDNRIEVITVLIDK